MGDVITWGNSVSVIIEHNGDKVLQWPIINARFDTASIALLRPELNITPDEAEQIVDNVLYTIEEMFDEYLEEWLEEVRG